MQQAGVIGVFDVLVVELPVRLRVLARAAEIFDRLVKDAIQPRQHLGTKIVGKAGRRIRQTAKHHAAIVLDPQRWQAVLRHIEIGRHAGLVLEPLLKRHAAQAAALVIGPLVVNAAMGVRIAAQFATHQRTAMGAAVDPGGDVAIAGAGDDYRRGADEGGFVIAGLFDFVGEGEEVPGRAAIDARLLAFEDRLGGEDRVGHPTTIHARPRKVVERSRLDVRRHRGTPDCANRAALPAP